MAAAYTAWLPKLLIDLSLQLLKTQVTDVQML